MRAAGGGRVARGRVQAVIALAVVLGVGVEAGPASAQGRRHALLVGVGDYIHDGVRDLEGPPHDVRSLEQALSRDWGFDRVTSLVDHEATRAAVLGAIDDLIRDTRPGDHVFLYFSGHGTSTFEGLDQDGVPGPLARTLDPGTGGLLPADIDLASSDAGDVLLVGRRDLRPRLARLDRDRDVFVVFDACYSGNTVRNWTPGGGAPAVKYQPWLDTAPLAFGSATLVADDRYPYDNLVYLSASAENELAWEIPQDLLEKYPTLDDRPHGLLTDALLRALAGDGDTDRNGELTLGELHRWVRENVAVRMQQTPQLLHPPGEYAALDEPVFGVERTAPRPPVETPSPPVSLRLRVGLVGVGAEALRERIAALDGVSVVTGAFDLYVEAEDPRGAITVRHGSGDLLAAGLEADAAVERVAWQALVHELLSESFPGDFNVDLEVLIVEERDGRRQAVKLTNAELFVGGSYEMRYAADVPAHFLLVTVDVRGAMRLLVPWTDRDLEAMREGRIPDLLVSRPTGTEFVKLFAFRDRPAGLDAWLPERGADGRRRVRTIESRRDLDALLRFVRAQAGVAATTPARKFVTAVRAR